MNSTELRRSIRDAIALNPDIKGQIDVEINGEVVRLKGMVFSLEERRLAERIARRLGARAIESDITLESGETDDERLAAAIDGAIDRAGLSGIAGVDKVVDGVVYLRGHADSADQAEAAISTAARAHGIRDVVSNIILSAPGPDSASLVNAVEQAIAVTGVHLENINISSNKGLITIRGVAWQSTDREKAGAAAKGVPGVRGVINRLKGPTEPISEDDRTSAELLRRLQEAPINTVNMNVVVVGGTAFLDGTVDSQKQRDEVTRITLSTPGVISIENNLAVAA